MTVTRSLSILEWWQEELKIIFRTYYYDSHHNLWTLTVNWTHIKRTGRLFWTPYIRLRCVLGKASDDDDDDDDDDSDALRYLEK